VGREEDAVPGDPAVGTPQSMDRREERVDLAARGKSG
jgi:hypothetical protein